MPSKVTPHIVIGCEDEALRDGLLTLQKALPTISTDPPATLRSRLEESLSSIVHAVMDKRIPELQTPVQPLETIARPPGVQSEDCLAIATWIGGDKHGKQAGQILLNATEKHVPDMRAHTTIEVRHDQSIGLAQGRINPDGETVDWYAFMVTDSMSTDNVASWAGILAQVLTPEAEVVMLTALNQRLEKAQQSAG